MGGIESLPPASTRAQGPQERGARPAGEGRRTRRRAAVKPDVRKKVLGRLNRIPVVGDEVELTSGTLRVTQMKGRRVRYLLFEPGTGGES